MTAPIDMPHPRHAAPEQDVADAATESGGSGFLQPDHDLPQTAAREVRVVRPDTWRRPASWAVDALPFVVGAVMLVRSFVRQAELSIEPRGIDGFLDLVAREWVIVTSVTVAAVLALAVYATLAHALAGATLGKKVFGLRLVCADGNRPTMARSAARSALCIVSGALLGLGFLVALFTRSGRALHDFLARTWVVRAP